MINVAIDVIDLQSGMLPFTHCRFYLFDYANASIYLHKSNTGNERMADFETDVKSLEKEVRPTHSHSTSLGNKMEKDVASSHTFTKYIVTNEEGV